MAHRGRRLWGLPLTCWVWAGLRDLAVLLHAFLEVGEPQGLSDEFIGIADKDSIPAGRTASLATGGTWPQAHTHLMSRTDLWTQSA